MLQLSNTNDSPCDEINVTVSRYNTISGIISMPVITFYPPSSTVCKNCVHSFIQFLPLGVMPLYQHACVVSIKTDRTILVMFMHSLPYLHVNCVVCFIATSLMLASHHFLPTIRYCM